MGASHDYRRGARVFCHRADPVVAVMSTLEQRVALVLAERDEARSLAEGMRARAVARGAREAAFPWEKNPERAEPWGFKLHRLIVAIPSVQFVTMQVKTNGGGDAVFIRTSCESKYTAMVRRLVEEHVPAAYGWSLEFTS